MKASSLTAPVTRRLEGNVALITGVQMSNGAKDVIPNVQDELSQSICKDINSKDDETITYTHCDVTNISDIKHVMDTTMSMYGKLDITHNNAAAKGYFGLEILNSDNEDFKRILEVKVPNMLQW